MKHKLSDIRCVSILVEYLKHMKSRCKLMCEDDIQPLSVKVNHGINLFVKNAKYILLSTILQIFSVSGYYVGGGNPHLEKKELKVQPFL